MNVLILEATDRNKTECLENQLDTTTFRHIKTRTPPNNLKNLYKPQQLKIKTPTTIHQDYYTKHSLERLLAYVQSSRIVRKITK